MERGSKLVKVVFGDVVLGVHSSEFSALFSYQTGGLESLKIQGKEWMYRTPKPTFWRALTNNDAGCGFQKRSGIWLAADMYNYCSDIKVWMNDQECVKFKAPHNNEFEKAIEVKTIKIRFTYDTGIEPNTQTTITYTVDCTGIHVDFHYYGKPGMPELPVVGMRFIFPTSAVKYLYKGLSGETYPDRKAGAARGVFEVEGLPVTKYLKPQECGMHMDTEWLEVYRNTTRNNMDMLKDEFSIRFEASDDLFHFSCLPYTAEELENATHHEELPMEYKTVLCIMAAVRGVGGIDSWGQDVLEEYRVSGETDKKMQFKICVPI